MLMERFKQDLKKRLSNDEVRESIKLADTKLDVLSPELCRQILATYGGGMLTPRYKRQCVAGAILKLKPVGIFMDSGHLRGCGMPFSEARFNAAVEEYLVWDATRLS